MGLLVSSNGGHLEQLVRLSERFEPEFDRVEFATFDSPQSRSRLDGWIVHHISNIPPRGWKQALAATGRARRLVKERGFTDVISTGAAVAVPFLLAAKSSGARAHYIESAARSQGPSLTGRIVQRLPKVNLYAQYKSWANDQWTYSGAIFDGVVSVDVSDPPERASRIVVTLGTIDFAFPRAVEAVQRILPDVAAENAEILWQLGETLPAGPPGAHGLVPAQRLTSAIRDADLVIAHAGVGSCLQILGAHRCPVLLPRLLKHGEHVDDHQLMIAQDLHDRGLAVTVDPEHMTADHARRAMAMRALTPKNPLPFRLKSH